MRRNSMTRRLLFAAAVLALTAVAAASVPVGEARTAAAKRAPGTWCGGKFWRQMTLSDVDRKAVDFHSIPTSIASIAALTSPPKIVTRRSSDFQRRTWRMQTVLDRYRIASNGEIVLVLFSIQTNQYMNAYLPNPNCLSSKSRDRTGMLAARNEFRSHCAVPTPNWQLLGATVDIAGIGFWNTSKSTRGALSNGAELRPVTNFRLIAGCGVG
jgi:hypothetical protein